MELFDGRYEKMEHLGSGAFAEVWKVRDVETDVVEALKIYTSHAGMDNVSVKLFTHEFALLANANHPNLVRPLHFAISKPEGYPYLRMKYCNNGSMTKQIGRMTEEEVWKLLHDISSALAYLHKMVPPVIHQDIKPENILKDNDKYMLSDFGVSTRVKSSLSRLSVMTDTLKKAGTTGYMAPERFSENKTPVMSNDIWSLGATIYELLTEELPFVMGGLTQANGEKTPKMHGPYSALLKQVIEDCMGIETWSRPRAEQLYEVARCVLDGHPVPDPLPWKETGNVIDTLPPSPASDNSKTADNGEDESESSNSGNKWPEPPKNSKISKAYIAVLAVAGVAIGVLLALI